VAALDNPARASLLGPHAHLARRRGDVLAYPSDMSPFIGLPDVPDEQAWLDVAALLGPDSTAVLAGIDAEPPAGWQPVFDVPCLQMIFTATAATGDPDAIELGTTDVADMLDLVKRAQPGPFLPRTHEMGNYLGIRRGGALIAMAGERMHPPGWTEVSAVCSDAAFRGQGLATRLVRSVVAGIQERGEAAVLHVAADNVNAIRLYESLGFLTRRTMSFRGLRVP
jgi:ribosomal protein S18 acetylase RimI-like enzyme